jgi:hypothetical protein
MGRHSYLKLLSTTTFIQCYKQLSIKPVGDSRTNHLEERGNDTIQVRSHSDFNVKFSIIHFYSIEHNSNPTIGSSWNLTWRFCWVNVSNELEFRTYDICQNRLYEFSYLFPFDLWTSYLWQGSFSYKDVAAWFGNLLILQRSLMGCNIVSKCDKDS